MEKFNIESTVLLSFKCWGFDGYFFYEAFYIHKLFQAINSIDWHHIQTNLLTHLNIKRSLSWFWSHLMRFCVFFNLCNWVKYVFVSSMPPGWVDDIIWYPGNIHDVVWTKAKGLHNVLILKFVPGQEALWRRNLN